MVGRQLQLLLYLLNHTTPAGVNAKVLKSQLEVGDVAAGLDLEDLQGPSNDQDQGPGQK